MKRLIIIISAVLMTLQSLAAGEVNSDRYVDKDYDLKGFNGITANGIYDVQLEKSDTWKVSISVPEALEDYLDVKVNNGRLVLTTKQVPLRISKNYSKWTVSAKVSMPVLKSLSLSGAAKFTCNDSFDIGDDTFKLEISGAGKANGLDIKAKELDMEMGGATSANITGDFAKADIEMAGAAKCDFTISADKMYQELSGAAKAYHSGDFATVEVEASGASFFSFTGSADRMELEASGAAKVNTSKGTARTVDASVSGAAYCEVNALENLKVEAIGASSIKYVDNSSLDLDIRSINRGSSVTKMK